MSAERLEDWAPRVAGALDRIPAGVEARFRALAPQMQAAARRRARVRTGAFRDSIQAIASGRSVHLSTDHPGASAFEQGGSLRGAPFLAIPLRDEVRAVRDPRRDGPLFRLRLRDGRVFLASRASGALDIRWRLAEAVTVRKSPTLLPAGAEVAATLPALAEATVRHELEVG